MVLAQRAKVVPLKEVTSEKCATPLGILYLNGKITKAQWEAGDRFTRIVAAWRWAVSAPKPYPSTADGKTGRVRYFLDEMDEVKAKNASRRAYEDSRGALMEAGTAAYTAVMTLCGQEREILQVGPASRGLTALAKYFEIEDE